LNDPPLPGSGLTALAVFVGGERDAGVWVLPVRHPTGPARVTWHPATGCPGTGVQPVPSIAGAAVPQFPPGAKQGGTHAGRGRGQS